MQRRDRHDAGRHEARFGGEGDERGADARERGARVGDGIELVDGEDDVRHAQQLREQGVAARLRQELERASLPRSSLVASTRTTAASLPAAAVTMFLVYCSWPGASAMMNLRSRVAK